jgi:hypothetical protein
LLNCISLLTSVIDAGSVQNLKFFTTEALKKIKEHFPRVL